MADDVWSRETQDYDKPIPEDDRSAYVSNLTWGLLDKDRTSHYDMGKRAGESASATRMLHMLRDEMAESLVVKSGKVQFAYDAERVLGVLVAELQRLAK